MHNTPGNPGSLITRLSQRDGAPFEWAIVILLAAILGLILFSRFNTTYRDARGATLVTTLQSLRGQLELYKIQHHDMPPTRSHPWTQLVNPTNVAGQTTAGLATADFPLGPYIKAPPVNPINGKFAVGMEASPNIGWVYQVSDSGFTLQAVNTDGDGVLTY